jgi:hypothetical protein
VSWGVSVWFGWHENCFLSIISIMRNQVLSRGLAMALLAGLGITQGYASVLDVTSTADGGGGSLRQVIGAANSGDTIQFSVNGSITLLSGELLVDKDLTITGPGAANLLINGNGLGRVFHVATNRTVSISGLTLTNGLSASGGVTSAGHNGDAASGGGVLNEGTLVLDSCVISGNRGGTGGSDSGSGATNIFGSCVKGGNGGGIANLGKLSLLNCSVTGNAAGNGGTETLTYLYVAVADGGNGGGIYNLGNLLVSNSVVSNNQAGNGSYVKSAGGYGGGIYSLGNVSIFNSSFEKNLGGSSGSLALHGLYVCANGGFGGGLCNNGTMGISASVIGENQAGNGGGGMMEAWNGDYPSNGGIGGCGAGIYNSGSLSLTNCTLAQNTCGTGGPGGGAIRDAAPAGNGGYGGGVYNDGSLNLVDCTVAFNAAGPQGYPGMSSVQGYIYYGADGYGGGVFTTTTQVHVINSIIAANLASTNIQASDVCGSFVSQGHNLVGIATTNGFTATGDLTGTPASSLQPGLARLGLNGGNTRTCGLIDGSSAINAGDDAVLSSPWFVTTDQTGATRKSGTHVDMGAYEYPATLPQYTLSVLTSGHGTVSVTPSTSSYYSNTLVTLVANPSANAVFDHWSGALTGGSVTNTLRMTSSLTVQANFLDLFAMTATTAGGGSIQMDSTNGLYVQDTTATLLATPSNGWQFICWTGDVTNANAQITVPMHKAANLQAVFGTPIQSSVSGDGAVYALPSISLYPYGSTATLFAVPGTGSLFTGWESSMPLLTNSSVSFTVTQATPPVTAHFAPRQNQVVRTVTTAADSGVGSLRQTITDAIDGDQISFAIAGPITIKSPGIEISKSLALLGPTNGSITLSGDGTTRLFQIDAEVSASFSNLTISNGNSSSAVTLAGGGILNRGNLALKNCSITGNSAGVGGGSGGGIASYGVLILDSCLVASNQAGFGGNGIIYGIQGLPGGNGGGIYSEGVLRVANSTIVSNIAGAGGITQHYYGSIPGGNAGVGGGICSMGDATFVNCTVTGNSTGIGGTPGCDWSERYWGDPGLPGNAGGLYLSSSARLINTLVAGNTVASGAYAPDIQGNPQSLGHNLFGALDTLASFALATRDIHGTTNSPITAMIAPLADNGGPTLTCALLVLSPAIDSGDDAVLSAPWSLAADQRGLARLLGTHVDIGAYEAPVVTPITARLSIQYTDANRLFTVVLTGTPGYNFDLQASEDLIHWNTTATLTNTTGQALWTLPLGSARPAQYFRARQAP